MFYFQNQTIASHSLDIYDARKAPMTLHGLFRPKEPGLFRRMPYEIASRVSDRVRRLSTNPSGARLRFRTDSDFIAVGAIYPPIEYVTQDSAMLCTIGASCFSLYADGHFCGVLRPSQDYLIQNGNLPYFKLDAQPGSPDASSDSSGSHQYEVSFLLPEKKMREITLCFPYFVNVSDVFIGVTEGSCVETADPYPNEKPVVFYGSSITQGACSSHSGNMYQNILSRTLNFDYLNLGFSGSALAEETIIDYICSLDMKVLVFDYDHNASPESLLATHYRSLAKLRQAHPDLPIIMLSRPNQCGGIEQVKQRLEIIEGNYRTFLKQGDENIYFVNGQDIFYMLDSDAATIDGCHPTDLGFYCMAQALSPVLKKCLEQ